VGSWPIHRPEVEACAPSPQDPTTCQALVSWPAAFLPPRRCTCERLELSAK
jgi:hypothetical protein